MKYLRMQHLPQEHVQSVVLAPYAVATRRSQTVEDICLRAHGSSVEKLLSKRSV